MDTATTDNSQTPTKHRKRHSTCSSLDSQATPTKRNKLSHVMTQRDAEQKDVPDEEDGIASSSLTMTNVKSIIYNVVKDADVQKMLSNTLESDASKLKAATYEPKMTRAKMKQVLAKEGNIPYPWPLSPVKSLKSKKKTNFTDLVFPDDDDDEDYSPDSDVADLSDMCSDEDTEGVLSAHGSPMCSALSPQVSRSPSLVLPVIPARHDNLPQTIMGPPPPVRTSKESERSFLDALDQLDLCDTIAKRTRSQLPLTDTTISRLEAEFVPPDITVDMYEDPEQEDEDPDWKNFLQNLLKDDVPVEDDDDDPEADPEYNVLAEPEAEDDHVLPMRVTKNEINLLMDEIYENELQDNDDDSQDAPTSFNKPRPLPVSRLTSVAELIKLKKSAVQSSQTAPAVENPEPVPVKPQPPPLSLNDYERAQLRRQMQASVQILCQQAIVGQVTAPHLYHQSTHFLNELSMFASSSKAGVQSAFNACNLSHAIALLQDYKPEEGGPHNELSLTVQQKTTLASSPVFMYPELLPSHPFKTPLTSTRVIFHHAEDVLICMGLDEFRVRSRNMADLIQEFLLPVFTPNSINMRIRNECKTCRCKKTTIGRFKIQGILPGAIRLCRKDHTLPMLPPVERHHLHIFPDWLMGVVKRDLIILTNPAASTATATAAAPAAIAPKPVSAAVEKPQSNPSTSPEAVADATTDTAADIPESTETGESDDPGTAASTERQVVGSTVPSTIETTSPSVSTASEKAESAEPSKDGAAAKPDTPGESKTVTQAVREPGILGILSDLSEVFVCSNEQPRGAQSETSELVLLTPTKRISVEVKSPNVPSPSKWRKIAASSLKTPEKQCSPLDPNWKMRHHSPRRKELRTKVQAIVPKSFVPTVFTASPTKMAAKALSIKAINRASQKAKYKSPLKNRSSPQKLPQPPPPVEAAVTGATKVLANKLAKAKAKSPSTADDEFFASLIEATTTTKAKSAKKHRYIACLASDIVESDPQRIKREDLFSRWYINKVKETLGENSSEYTNFLEALIAFGKQKKNPAIFFGELKESILKDREELLQGFAAFLLPTQAIACGEKCYKTCLQFNKARRFLRRIEVYFGANSKLFQKLIKLLRSCNGSRKPRTSTEELRAAISSLLKSHPVLLDEFTNFFPDAAPPKRHKDDYEQMDLTEFDEETVMDGYEEMEIPEVEETNATLQCKCTCHSDEGRPAPYHSRKMHCESCRIAVLHSRLFIHAGPKRGLRPAYIRYLNPLPAEPSAAADSEDDDSDLDYEPTFVDNVGSPRGTKVHPPSANAVEVLLGAIPNPIKPEGEVEPSVATSSTSPVSWSRDEDQMLLEAMQQGDSLALSNDALLSLSTNMGRRTKADIKARFEVLLKLLSQRLGSDEESLN